MMAQSAKEASLEPTLSADTMTIKTEEQANAKAALIDAAVARVCRVHVVPPTSRTRRAVVVVSGAMLLAVLAAQLSGGGMGSDALLAQVSACAPVSSVFPLCMQGVSA